MAIELGQKGKDRITGFTGVCTGRVNYISGCDQALIVPGVNDKGEMQKGEWFDVQRIQVLADEQIVLDNAVTPGPDLWEAPKR